MAKRAQLTLRFCKQAPMLKCWSIVPISFVECASAWLKCRFFGPNAPAKRGRLKFFSRHSPHLDSKVGKPEKMEERSSTPLKHCSIMFYPFGLHESSSLYVTSLTLYLYLSISLGFPRLSAFKLFLGPRPPRPHHFIR